jgi:type I restriction enzyme M protein
MSTSAKQKVQQAELHKKLWAIANDLRGTMDASEFRNYILGLIFYRYLSEKTEQRVVKLLEEDNITTKKPGKIQNIKKV